jgi:hypothetical protein
MRFDFLLFILLTAFGCAHSPKQVVQVEPVLDYYFRANILACVVESEVCIANKEDANYCIREQKYCMQRAYEEYRLTTRAGS